MKNSVARIVHYSILVALLLIALIVALLLNSFRSNRRVVITQNMPSVEAISNTNHKYQHFDAKEVRELDIDWVSGAITLDFGETEELVLAESGTDSMTVKLDGNTLKLKYPDNGLTIGNQSKDLHILVPRDWECRSLIVDTVSASLQVQDGTIEQMKFNTTSGTSRLENCALDELAISTISGSVNFSGTVSDFDFEGTSASAELDIANCPDSIKMDTISGSMTLHLPTDCGFTADHDSISGKLHSDFSTTTHGSKQVHGDGACEIDFEGVSASLTIHDRGESAHHEKSQHR